MTLLWVSGCPFILVPFVWVQVWVRVQLRPQPFGYGGGTGEVGLFFPWKKQLASLRHLFSGGKNNPTSPSVTISGHRRGRQLPKTAKNNENNVQKQSCPLY